MSVTYKAVNWSRNKWIYDATIFGGIAAYLAIFVATGLLVRRAPEAIGLEVLLIRALGTCAFLMLQIVLCIGPLARLDRRLLPLLYNRRHFGVATFLVALAHAVLATGYYHGFGRVTPLVSLLVSNTNFSSLTAFPFELLGAAGLIVLLLLAVTSHDFWQRNLGPTCWKRLHMLIYSAYGLIVMHVALGALQSERSWAFPLLAVAGLGTVSGLHLAAGWREQQRDRGNLASAEMLPHEWIDAGLAKDIADCRAKVVCLPGRERIAVFRYGNRVSAVTNVCAHQRGPLGEGKIIDGCITCPWHGWEYRPENGQSPPPFQERIATYRIRLENGRVWIDPRPLPPGTPVEPALLENK